MSPVAVFALVHAAAVDAWYWHLLSAELRARGHDVVAADLPVDDDADRHRAVLAVSTPVCMLPRQDLTSRGVHAHDSFRRTDSAAGYP